MMWRVMPNDFLINVGPSLGNTPRDRGYPRAGALTKSFPRFTRKLARQDGRAVQGV